MIPLAKAQSILELSEAGLSQRQVAATLKIARGTVRAVLRGTWAGWSRHAAKSPRPAQAKPRLGRCPECGRRVLLPCRACQSARHPAARRPLPVADQADLEPQLSGRPRQRYERLRRAKQAQAEATAGLPAEAPPAPASSPGQTDRVLTCCARCLWPLTVPIGQSVTIYDRNTARPVRRCPNCHRQLPRLTPEEIYHHLQH